MRFKRLILDWSSVEYHALALRHCAVPVEGGWGFFVFVENPYTGEIGTTPSEASIGPQIE